MDKIAIVGGKKLSGKVSASGAKNAALPLLFSTLLAEGTHVFHNVPMLADIDSTIKILELLGCKIQRQDHTLRISVTAPKDTEVHYDIVRKMRASILCLGPLLTKYGSTQVSLPGGCAIGTRPIDLHLDGVKALGAKVRIEEGYVHAESLDSAGKRIPLQGGTILFDTVTVGGTENMLMAASLASGVTVIENAAKEPEVVDLANYLIKMGAKIEGAGSSVITVTGVPKLTPAEHSVIPDRIEVGTLLIAGAITGGDVTVEKCSPDDLHALMRKLREAGFTIECGKDWIRVLPNSICKAVDITTEPHPGFPTDLQAQFMALMTQADGTSVISETIFENRFMHVQELVRLGAQIRPKSRVAIVKGARGGLQGAPVMATDLRASASLVLAGLAANGETIVGRIYHLDRGYENLEGKLSSLGASVERQK